MNTLSSVVCVLAISASFASAQTPAKNDYEAIQKMALLADVKTLALEIPKLDGPLARALAHAEIADAAWTLDQNWAKTLLRDAYQLTYLTEEELGKIGPEPRGSAPIPPTPISRARTEVRRRILTVARRDSAFADQLLTDTSARVTKDDRQMMYAQLTRLAMDEGDNQTAIRSIQDNIAIDPTRIVFVELVNELAIKDRAAADKLILECLANLSSVPVPEANRGWDAAFLTVRWLVFPNSFFPDPNKQIPNPGADVMKAYVRYVIDTLSALEQRQPGTLFRQRSMLLTAWLPLNQYAPELMERFMQLEAVSRVPGKDASLPAKSNEELDQEMFRNKQSEALNSREANEQSIDSMINREEFDTARKLIEKLPDGERKTVFLEQVNTKEAISLTKKGDLLRAQSLAERLMTIGSMLQVYPLIVQGYASNKDQAGASSTIHQAIRQLKNANTKPVPAGSQFGMPAEFRPTANEIDGVLSALEKLAKAILPFDSLLGSEVVNEVVVRANASRIDTAQGRTGIDSGLFKSLASQDEVRARSAAENFKDRLRRIVALAAIYHWKANQLEKATATKTTAQ